MLRPEPNVTILIASLVVVSERITSGFSTLLVEPAARKYATCHFNSHHCRAGAAVLDRRYAFEAGLDPVINIALTGDVVVGDTVMRQVDDRVLPASTS
jgi:hypothetical protein